MNPRDFCRTTGYTSTVALTYSFNPTFFEQLVLPDLWYGGTGEIVVVADQRQLEDSLSLSAGQLRFLGVSYHLTPAKKATFHPKLLLRIGASGAYLWLGSGNITHGGWGGNQELAIAWKLDSDSSLACGIVKALLDQILRYCEGTNAAEAIRRIGDRSWITSVGAEQPRSPVVLTLPHRPLCDELADRWSGRRFTSLRVFTGSTDRDGRFIKWCHDTFGIERCVVAVDPRTSDFDPRALEALPVNVEIVPALESPYLHAKLYWFEGADGCAAVVGSANCSAAAWLLAPNLGGNVEMIFIHDDMAREDFSKLLGRYPEAGLKPSTVPELGSWRDRTDQNVNDVRFRLVELTRHAAQNRLAVRTDRPIPPGSLASLRIVDETIALDSHDGNRTEWDLPYPEILDDGRTIFGQLIIEADGQKYVSPPRWVDDQEKLRLAARRGGFGRIAGGLKWGRSTAERNAFLEELQLITKSLFSEPGAYPDPMPERKKAATDNNARPVQPSDVLRQLADIESKPSDVFGHDDFNGFSLYGIMRELFGGNEEENDVPPESELTDDRVSDVGSATGSPRIQPDEDAVRDKTACPPTDRQKQRLKKTMETYSDQLNQKSFAAKCSASQLIQAISLPLLIASSGHDRGWFDRNDARLWVLRAVDRLFRVQAENGTPSGLINIVRQRYDSEGRSDTFLTVVGDGTLWLSLVCAISGIEWDTTTEVIERALTMQEVLRCGELLATAEVGRLGLLVPRLQSISESKTFLRKAEKVDAVMASIESFLREHFDYLKERQVGGEHDEGDLAWGKSGWGTVRESSAIAPSRNVSVYWRTRGEEVKMKAARFFVNVTKAARCYPALARMIDELKVAFAADVV